MPRPLKSILCVALLGALRVHASNLTLITEPQQGLDPIYSLVKAAVHTIDLTMYEMDDPAFQQALVAQAAAGVAVRVILDQNREQGNNQAAFTYLSGNGVQVHWGDPVYAATHQKTITIDAAYGSAQTAVMTLNLTPRYYASNRDFAVIENDLTDIAAIEATFESDFTSTAITPATGDHLVWSPTNSGSALVRLISSAHYSLLVENEEMGDASIVNALASAAQRGVDVRIVLTDTDGEFSAEFTQLTAAGADVSTYSPDEPLYIHAKVILADLGFPTEAVFIGSENFSIASLTENRELGLLLHDEGIGNALNVTMAADFAGGMPWLASPWNFSLSSSSNALTAMVEQPATSTIIFAPLDGFLGSVALTVTGLPEGVTAQFNPLEISAAVPSSTLTLSVSGFAARGVWPLVVVARGGGVTRMLPMTLAVIGSVGGRLCPASCRALGHPGH